MPRNVTPSMLRSIIIAEYPYRSTRELVQMYGVPRGTITSMGRRLGLKKDKRTMVRINRLRGNNLLNAAKYGDAIAKRTRTQMLMRRADNRRLLCGEKPIHGFRVSRLSERQQYAKRRLLKRGYIETDDAFVFLYDEHTRRGLNRNDTKEEHYFNKYRFRFFEAEHIEGTSYEDRTI